MIISRSQRHDKQAWISSFNTYIEMAAPLDGLILMQYMAVGYSLFYYLLLVIHSIIFVVTAWYINVRISTYKLRTTLGFSDHATVSQLHWLIPYVIVSFTPLLSDFNNNHLTVNMSVLKCH